eukprot:16446245-Heterocapsa_arctica.AAC.1
MPERVIAAFDDEAALACSSQRAELVLLQVALWSRHGGVSSASEGLCHRPSPAEMQSQNRLRKQQP